jgi:sRNA-binding regulator protein Hfq
MNQPFMKSLLLTLFVCLSIVGFSQADKLYLHNGKTVEGSVVRNSEFTVIYKYVNEDAEQTISKYAVDKIVYGKSGRTEILSPKINVRSEDDWSSVMILEDNAASAGLTKIGEVRGKTSLINYRTAAGSDKKAEEKLKREAAKQGCHFVILTSDKDAGMQSNGSRNWGGVQSMKKGIGYKY